MMRRPSLLLLTMLLPLGGCGQQSAPADSSVADAAARAASVPCALGGSATFQQRCTVERTVSGDGLALVMHHPDGGFRRLLVTTDGRGVVTADGADEAAVSVIDPGTIEVTVGDDRYRLPATVKGQDLPAR
jgi:outer membrane lipoprotein-sorting protein